VIVVRYGKTRRGELTEAAKILGQSGGSALGCVINDVRFATLEARRKYRFWYSAWKRAKKKGFTGRRRKI
jgi:Mrp family chromosome partitioning ATPase